MGILKAESILFPARIRKQGYLNKGGARKHIGNFMHINFSCKIYFYPACEGTFKNADNCETCMEENTQYYSFWNHKPLCIYLYCPSSGESSGSCDQVPFPWVEESTVETYNCLCNMLYFMYKKNVSEQAKRHSSNHQFSRQLPVCPTLPNKVAPASCVGSPFSCSLSSSLKSQLPSSSQYSRLLYLSLTHMLCPPPPTPLPGERKGWCHPFPVLNGGSFYCHSRSTREELTTINCHFRLECFHTVQ